MSPFVYTMNKRGRRRGRQYRRNQIAGAMRGAMQFQKWVPLALTGGFSGIATGLVPGMIGIVNPWARLGTQIATIFVGAGLVQQMMRGNHGQAWIIGGTSLLALDLLRTWLPRFGVALPLGAYEDYGPDTDATGLLYGYPEQGGRADGVGAFTDQNLQGLGAYPEEIESDPLAGVGAFPYPYGGQH